MGAFRGWIAAALMVGVVAGGVLVTPVGAHVGGTVSHLWRDHIRGKVANRHYTKAQSDNRYFTKSQTNGRFYSRTQSDGRYYTKADAGAAFLTPAEGDAAFLTPAEGDAAFLTPAEGAAAYSPLRHGDLARYCSGLAPTGHGPCQSSARAVETIDEVGTFPSVAVGTDGFPVVAYRDETNDDLQFVHCTAVDCSSHDGPVDLDTVNAVGRYTSVAIGTDGNPIISYFDDTADDVQVVHCDTADCSSRDAPVDIDATAGDSGGKGAIAIGSDGMPVVAYFDDGEDDIQLVRCTAVDCATADAPVDLDTSAGAFGGPVSVAIGSDGFPAVAYFDNDGSNLGFVHCDNVGCTAADTPLTLDETGVVGGDNAIAIGSDGFPLITYFDGTEADLNVLHCTAVDCSTRDTRVILDSTSSAGTDTRLVIGPDGLPVIAYFRSTAAEVMAMRCADAECSVPGSPVTVAGTEESSSHVGLALGADGVPVVAYYVGGGSDDLGFARLGAL